MINGLKFKLQMKKFNQKWSRKALCFRPLFFHQFRVDFLDFCCCFAVWGNWKNDIGKKQQINVIKKQVPQKHLINFSDLYEKNNFELAEEKGYELIEKYADNPTVYEILAMSCLKLNKLLDAVTFMKKAIELNPKQTNYYVNLGFIYRGLERFEDAKVVYNKAIDMDPNNYLPYYNLGVLFQKQGFFEDAKDQYVKTINLDPNCNDAYNNLANAIAELGI